MAVNRTRNKAITLRMTAEELALFQSQFEKSEAKNQTDFVLQLLDEKPIVVNHELSEVLAELKRQGNNLNQIAKQLNQGTPFGEASKRVMNECWVTYRKIRTPPFKFFFQCYPLYKVLLLLSGDPVF